MLIETVIYLLLMAYIHVQELLERVYLAQKSISFRIFLMLLKTKNQTVIKDLNVKYD